MLNSMLITESFKIFRSKSFICSLCGHNEIGPRFRIEVKVSHQKENTKFVLWDRECILLIKETAKDLEKKLMDEGELNPMASPVAIDKVLKMTLAFRVKAQPSYNRCSVNHQKMHRSLNP